MELRVCWVKVSSVINRDNCPLTDWIYSYFWMREPRLAWPSCQFDINYETIANTGHYLKIVISGVGRPLRNVSCFRSFVLILHWSLRKRVSSSWCTYRPLIYYRTCSPTLHLLFRWKCIRCTLIETLFYLTLQYHTPTVPYWSQ